jgi:peptidoglycan/xylan/chitin deacetylase (PgdA/CDA1 family)
VSRLGRARRAASTARLLAEQRFGSWLRGGIVLLYHRVTTLATDPQLLAVTPERFRQHMEVLRSEYAPMPLGELARRSRRGRAPRRAVAVTFDDGYADNLYEAEPILRELGIPATVFVATGHVGTDREFWWDELERLMLLGGERPAELRVSHRGEGQRHPTRDESERRAAYDALHPWLRFGPLARREDVLAQVRGWAGEPEGGRHRDTHRAVTVDELRELAASPVVEIAPHTRAHPSLAHQDLPVQREEIAGSARQLEDWLGTRSPVFSYPFGGPGADYDRATVSAVREAGFQLAVSNFPARVTPLSSPFELPRHLVRDWDADYFGGWLAERASG